MDGISTIMFSLILAKELAFLILVTAFTRDSEGLQEKLGTFHILLRALKKNAPAVRSIALKHTFRRIFWYNKLTSSLVKTTKTYTIFTKKLPMMVN